MAARPAPRPDPASFTPAQRRTWEDLLAAGGRRPPVDRGAAARWRAWLEERLAPAAALVPAGERGLWISKGKLDALSCEGRFLDQRATPFSWSLRTVLGTVSHRGIEIDLGGRRQRGVDEVIAQALCEVAAADGAAGLFIAQLGGAEADDLRAQAANRVLEFREVFPLLPVDWLRTEVACTVRVAEGRLVLAGRPDLVVGRSHPRRRQQLLIDLKTGNRHAHHVADMRFYALLALFKYGVAPFRVATFYLDEADWEVEEVTDDHLEAAARTLVDKVTAAARLTYATPSEDRLRLAAGPACAWCTRAPSCPAAAGADERALALR